MALLPRSLLALPVVLLLQAGACAAPSAQPASSTPPAAPASPPAPAPPVPAMETPAGGGCTSDSQCPRGEVCVRCGAEASCAPGCHEDSQCPPGSRCRQVQCIRCPCPGQCD